MKYADLLKILITIATTAKAKIPAIMAWLDQTLALFEIGNAAANSLQLVEPTAEELALEGELSQALTAEGSQAVFNGSRLRKLVQLAGEYGPTIFSLVKLFAAM